jgi:putative addiction module component (TIGR02574 family)
MRNALAVCATRCQNIHMNRQLTPEDIRRLPVADRLRLIEELWDSLDAEAAEALPLPEWHKAELDKRLDAHESDPAAARPWDEVKSDILAALRK